MSKLKFSWLELRTKQVFLERLLDFSVDAWRELPAEWSPADLRAFERETVEPLKQDLQRTKAQQATLRNEIGLLGERIGTKRMQLEKLVESRRARLERIEKLLQEKRELEASVPKEAPLEASPAELSALLAQQNATLEKLHADVQARRSALTELDRLCALHSEESQKVSEQLQVLEEDCTQMQDRSEARPQLAALIQWYQKVQQLSRQSVPYLQRVEVVRGDYLTVTVQTSGGPLELHVGLDPVSGRILSVRGAPQPLVSRAIEYNDLAYLIRALN